jgi:DNA primase
MTGRINDEDVALVRERTAIAEIVADQVTLRSAGGGRLKGLCPFHDERTPSFTVSPANGFFKCFGCGEGGDVISFVMKLDHLTFTETVERLASRAGVTLRYAEGGFTANRQHGQRTRLVAAHAAAAAFYQEQLAGDGARLGRRFLAERGFDQQAAHRFHVGYSPAGWDSLVKHLRGQSFTEEELVAGGLARPGQRGLVDRFRGRLMWPIRDLSGDVVGFGARKLDEDHDSGPKYLNTPETPLYKKSQLLYGVDIAKREIARRMQAVIVEGYTDVMACHLAGIETAVATCGTAFAEEHIKVLRRLLMDQNEFRGEVVFTFDGDAAGQKAALRAFGEDQKFVTQTFVAVEPSGKDPCELRQSAGDAAVRDLVARRVPLFEFAIRSVLDRYDLDTAEGRTAARSAAMDVIRQIRDVALRVDYARRLAGWIGLPDPDELVALARGSVRDARGQQERKPPTIGPDDSSPAAQVEREALKLALQQPELAGPVFDAIHATSFTVVEYRAVREAIAAADGATESDAGESWVSQVLAAASDDTVRSTITGLAVEPMRSDGAVDSRYADAVLARVEELALTRTIAELKPRLQRLNPVEAGEEHGELFGRLVTLEQRRRGLRERAIGAL